MAPPTIRQSKGGTSSSMTTPVVSVSLDQPALSGTLLVFCLAGDKNTGALTMDGTGWNTDNTAAIRLNSSSVSLYVAWKVAAGGETTLSGTVGTAPVSGNTFFAMELDQAGAGAWGLLARVTNNSDGTTSLGSLAIGTTSPAAPYEGLAVAVGAVDSISSFSNSPTWTNSFTNRYTPPSDGAPGSDGGSAGCYVATLPVAQGATTSTTFDPGTGTDQISGAIALFGRQAPPTPPGSVFDLDDWKLTLPTGPVGNPTDIVQPELDTYTDDNFKLNASNQMVMTAPVQGTTTSGSGGTRCEFREMEGDDEAGWNMATTGTRRLTVTGIFDPTSITGGTQPRQEMIVGQIHGPSGTPPMYLSVEFTSGVAGNPVTPRLRVYKDGPGLANILSPLTATTAITYRIEVGGGRCKLWAAIGQVADLPASPQFDWAASEFTEDTTVCYLKAGSYNKSLAANGNSGAAIATITYLELVQPAPAPEPGRFLLAYC